MRTSAHGTAQVSGVPELSVEPQRDIADQEQDGDACDCIATKAPDKQAWNSPWLQHERIELSGYRCASVEAVRCCILQVGTSRTASCKERKGNGKDGTVTSKVLWPFIWRQPRRARRGVNLGSAPCRADRPKFSGDAGYAIKLASARLMGPLLSWARLTRQGIASMALPRPAQTRARLSRRPSLSEGEEEYEHVACACARGICTSGYIVPLQPRPCVGWCR